MNTNHNIHIVKLLVRILDTKVSPNHTSVSIGFQNKNQNETYLKTTLKPKKKHK